ncbi:MAG TPA: single-stranded DNA-binding protein [Sphingomicrobium sp.]|nr:single-stranded DNA-binding protein [Sphingomicrobium sp.]
MRCIIELIGRLSSDPMIRPSHGGDRHAFLKIETIERWQDRTSGAQRTRSTWHDVKVAKSGIVKAIERQLKQGDLVFVAGTLRYSEWTDASEVKRKTAEILVKAAEHQLIFL